jgi:hypothetical protein
MKTETARHERASSVATAPNVRETADRISRDHERRLQQSVESYEKSANEILENARGELRKALGADNLTALRRLMRRERLAWHERMQPPEGPSRNLPEEVRARKQAALKFLDEVGVSPDRLRQIVRTHFGHIRDLPLTPATRPGIAYPLPGFEGKLRDLLDGPLQTNPHRWFTCRPPFESSQIGWFIARSPKSARVGVYPEREVDVDTGRLWHRMWLSIVDASDIDLAHGILDSQVECPFTAPAAGRVQVVIEAACHSSVHALKVDDEWGISDSTTDQRNFLMMHVLHPNVSGPSVAEMSHFRYETDYSTNQVHEPLTKGGDYFAAFTSDGAVAANDTMIIRAGTRTDDATMTNDMEISSTSTFEWTIKSIHVRIVP